MSWTWLSPKEAREILARVGGKCVLEDEGGIPRDWQVIGSVTVGEWWLEVGVPGDVEVLPMVLEATRVMLKDRLERERMRG